MHAYIVQGTKGRGILVGLYSGPPPLKITLILEGLVCDATCGKIEVELS
jgi:hypothetical protein